MRLLPFQRRFLRSAFAPGVRTAALSLPRGNGKSTLAAHLAQRCVTPGDPLHVPDQETLLVAASLGQIQRTIFAQVRRSLPDPDAYKISDSANNQARIMNRETKARVTALPANPRTAQGLLGHNLIICDEPGAWGVSDGLKMWDAIETALGKPESRMRVLIVGTLAPGGIPGNWWYELVHTGSGPGVHVTALQGDLSRWDDANEIRKANPLMWKFPDSRKVLLTERDAARRDTRLKARFMSYRLNQPSRDESEVLLTVDDWDRICARPVPERQGKPIVGLDLGGGRSWSAATGLWPNGRVEAVAVAPGLPDIQTQEKRDRVPIGTYSKLIESGNLRLADGLRVQPPAHLIDMLREWQPEAIVCDRFRLAELRDTKPPCPVIDRVTRWSTAAEDIRALRAMAMDGPLAVEHGSRSLLAHALAMAKVKNDDQGSVRLVKADPKGCTGRDDAAAALTLAAGLRQRVDSKPKPRYRGLA